MAWCPSSGNQDIDRTVNKLEWLTVEPATSSIPYINTLKRYIADDLVAEVSNSLHTFELCLKVPHKGKTQNDPSTGGTGSSSTVGGRRIRHIQSSSRGQSSKPEKKDEYKRSVVYQYALTRGGTVYIANAATIDNLENLEVEGAQRMTHDNTVVSNICGYTKDGLEARPIRALVLIDVKDDDARQAFEYLFEKNGPEFDGTTRSGQSIQVVCFYSPFYPFLPSLRLFFNSPRVTASLVTVLNQTCL